MPNGLKQKLISTIGFSRYRKLLTTVMRGLNRIDTKMIVSSHVSEIKRFSVDGRDCFFGYYDLQSMNSTGDKLLSIATTKDDADVGYFEIASGEFHRITETHAWNWQMGCRMRWYTDNDSILFNDYDGDAFISRIVQIDGKEITRYPFPIFDITNDHKTAYFTDFTILHHLREGYGYSNKNVDFEEYYRTTQNGLFKADLQKGTTELIYSIGDLLCVDPIEGFEISYQYINHITINQDNGDVMFFHLWTEDKKTWKNRMIFIDTQGQIINTICDFDRASHYDWQDQEHILVSIYMRGKTEYRLYNYRTGEYELMEGMSTDGHPTFLNSRYFLTDTYPNRCGMQSLYLCDSKLHTYKNIFSIYHVSEKTGPNRCDLHPRRMGRWVNIDCVESPLRCQYIMQVAPIYESSQLWDRRLLLDKNAIVENSGPKSASLFSCMNSEYLFTTGRKKGQPLKILLMYLNGPIFRVNVLVAQMQITKSKSKKKRIRNKLETKYGIIVDQNAIVGKHFRADHAVGIVIGPGAVIGDYLKIYQNVTIGQKNGKFPKIGNHVLIYPGAKIFGDIEIGDYSVIGANAVVTCDVPKGATAVGVPARIIPKKEDYEQIKEESCV